MPSFKGGSSGDRTPSMWVLPGSNTIAVRMSSVYQPSVGADGNLPLPLRAWAHVALTVANVTTEPGQATLVATLFVNGVLDVQLTFSDPILGNSAPLLVGQDAWSSATRMLVEGLRAFGHPLSSAEVQLEFRRGSPPHRVVCTAWPAGTPCVPLLLVTGHAHPLPHPAPR